MLLLSTLLLLLPRLLLLLMLQSRGNGLGFGISLGWRRRLRPQRRELSEQQTQSAGLLALSTRLSSLTGWY
jgi:hypothetical protein